MVTSTKNSPHISDIDSTIPGKVFVTFYDFASNKSNLLNKREKVLEVILS